MNPECNITSVSGRKPPQSINIPNSKSCSKCGLVKDLSEFHRDCRNQDGHIAQCKSCIRLDKQRYYRENAARLRENKRKQYVENPEPSLSAARKYEKTQKGYANRLIINRRHCHLHPQRARARQAIRTAVFRGKIIKPTICSQCGGDGTIHGHHPDYSKPLEVEWLCDVCHRIAEQSSQGFSALIL